MSRQLDISKFKDIFINGIRVAEMWFRGDRIYSIKQAPTLLLRCGRYNIGTRYKYLRMTGEFKDYGNRHLYFDEVPYSSTQSATHGILYITKSELGGGVLDINTPGANIHFNAEYDADGKFTYDLERSYTTAQNLIFAMRAFVKVQNPVTGEEYFIYSNGVTGSYTSLR